MTPDGVPKDDVRVPEGQLGRDITDGFASGADISMCPSKLQNALYIH